MRCKACNNVMQEGEIKIRTDEHAPGELEELCAVCLFHIKVAKGLAEFDEIEDVVRHTLRSNIHDETEWD